MNKRFSIPMIGILICSYAYANGDIRMIDGENVSERTERTREKMRENPRNSGFPGSFGQVGSQNETQERQEEKAEWLDELKEGTYWDNGNSATTNKVEDYEPKGP